MRIRIFIKKIFLTVHKSELNFHWSVRILYRKRLDMI
jgi:hypothetical protein